MTAMPDSRANSITFILDLPILSRLTMQDRQSRTVIPAGCAHENIAADSGTMIFR
jgi:hypothetical protein